MADQGIGCFSPHIGVLVVLGGAHQGLPAGLALLHPEAGAAERAHHENLLLQTQQQQGHGLFNRHLPQAR